VERIGSRRVGKVGAGGAGVVLRRTGECAAGELGWEGRLAPAELVTAVGVVQVPEAETARGRAVAGGVQVVLRGLEEACPDPAAAPGVAAAAAEQASVLERRCTRVAGRRVSLVEGGRNSVWRDEGGRMRTLFVRGGRGSGEVLSVEFQACQRTGRSVVLAWIASPASRTRSQSSHE
jgi:hypothetical protein